MPMPTPAPVRLTGRLLSLAGHVAPEWIAALLNRATFHPLRSGVRSWHQEGLERAERGGFEAPFGFVPALTWSPAEPRGTVLMVHGWEGRASQFGPIGLALRDAGLRAVAIDMPAHGDAPRRASSPRNWFDSIEAALGSLGPLTGMVTHSMGVGPSLVALERGHRTERLVAIAPPSAMAPRMRTAATRLGLDGRAAEAFARRSTARIVRHGGEADFTQLARRFTRPLLVLHPPDDELVGLDEGRRLAAAAPEGQFLETGAHGHFRVLREADTLAATRAFLCASDLADWRPAPLSTSGC